MAGSVLNSTIVLRLNFCEKLNICASISGTSQSRKTLYIISPKHRMRRNFGIFFIMILTISVIGLLTFVTNVSLFIIVREMPEERARIVSKQVIMEILPYFGIAFLSLILVNNIILKKILLNKNSFSNSIIISTSTILISIVILLGLKKKFIEQNKMDYQKILEMRRME